MIAETFTANGFDVEIVYDSDCSNPREGFDYHLGKMMDFSRDGKTVEVEGYDPEDYYGWDDFQTALEKDGFIVLPLYRYSHSGTVYNTTGFSCRWDSGQVGFYVTTLAAIRECYMVKRFEEYKVRAKAIESLRDEVEEWSKWVAGECYGYRINDPETGDEVDSCWGFIGLECVTEEATAAANAMDAPLVQTEIPV